MDVDLLEAYSVLYGLGHSREHLLELAPRVAEHLARLERLRELNVADVEMAVVYVPRHE